MLFSVSMFPLGNNESLAAPVAEVIDEIDRAGLKYHVTGIDTVIEGSWTGVIEAIGAAEARLRRKYDRVYMVLTMDDHKGARNRLTGAVEDVARELGREIN